MAANSNKRKNNPKLRPKQIVYLFGAGATQAEVDYLGAQPVNLLMRDHDLLGEGVSTGILAKMGPRGVPFLADRGVDIEKLISLLSASGIDSHSKIADKMRKLYFEEICTRLVDSQIIERPQLAIGLLEMHTNDSFQDEVETLTGILTTNHDGLLQIASEEVFGAVNIGFPFASEDLTPVNSEFVPPLIQLHGSFTWKFAVPLNVRIFREGSKYSSDTMWIPPTVLKEAKSYPFNKLAGLGYEILAKRCDVLRVIGASLSQNDWNVLAIIFNAQRHREHLNKAPFRIELIMSQKSGIQIQSNCSYLKNITPIGSITEGQFAEYREYEEEDPPAGSHLGNAFFYWLREKIQHHRKLKEFGVGALTGTLAVIAGEAR